MRIELLQNANEIRQNLTDRFLLSRDNFKIEYKDFVQRLEDFDQWYDQSYMWDKLPGDVPNVTFVKALELLRSRKGEVLFMSEREGFGASCHLTIDGEKTEGFVAKADARELAEKISYEWYEGIKLFLQERYIADTLPEDLYVFDETYEWLIVFTHETDPEKDFTEEAADTRLCLVCGFEI